MADTPGNDAAAQVSETTRQAADSRQMGWAARAGLTARAVVYLLIGSLALAVASGSGAKMDQKGALAQVLAQPFGPVMVTLLALGFVGYAAWRLTEGRHRPRTRGWSAPGVPGPGTRLRLLGVHSRDVDSGLGR